MTERKPRIPPEPLDESDLEDIRRNFADRGAKWLAEWIGCDRSTVLTHAKRLGVYERRKSGPAKAVKPLTPLQQRQDRETPGATKVCTACDKLLPLADFNARMFGRQGCNNRCKPCELAQRRARYQRDASTERGRAKAQAAAKRAARACRSAEVQAP